MEVTVHKTELNDIIEVWMDWALASGRTAERTLLASCCNRAWAKQKSISACSVIESDVLRNVQKLKKHLVDRPSLKTVTTYNNTIRPAAATLLLSHSPCLSEVVANLEWQSACILTSRLDSMDVVVPFGEAAVHSTSNSVTNELHLMIKPERKREYANISHIVKSLPQLYTLGLFFRSDYAYMIDASDLLGCIMHSTVRSLVVGGAGRVMWATMQLRRMSLGNVVELSVYGPMHWWVKHVGTLFPNLLTLRLMNCSDRVFYSIATGSGITSLTVDFVLYITVDSFSWCAQLQTLDVCVSGVVNFGHLTSRLPYLQKLTLRTYSRYGVDLVGDALSIPSITIHRGSWVILGNCMISSLRAIDCDLCIGRASNLENLVLSDARVKNGLSICHHLKHLNADVDNARQAITYTRSISSAKGFHCGTDYAHNLRMLSAESDVSRLTADCDDESIMFRYYGFDRMVKYQMHIWK